MRPIGRPAEPGYGWPCCCQRHCMSPWPPFSGGRSDPIRPNPMCRRWCSNSCALGPTRQRPTSRHTTTDRHPQKRRQCRLRLRTMTPCPYHQRPRRLPPAPRSIPWPSPPERPNPCRRHRNAPRALSGPTRRPSGPLPPRPARPDPPRRANRGTNAPARRRPNTRRLPDRARRRRAPGTARVPPAQAARRPHSRASPPPSSAPLSARI